MDLFLLWAEEGCDVMMEDKRDQTAGQSFYFMINTLTHSLWKVMIWWLLVKMISKKKWMFFPEELWLVELVSVTSSDFYLFNFNFFPVIKKK